MWLERLHFLAQCRVRARRVMGKAAVANPPVFLQLRNRSHVHCGIAQIVNLHQIDEVGVHEIGRAFHLRNAGLAAVRPDLGGQEESVAPGTRIDNVTDDFLRAVVHGRGVQQAAAGRDKAFHNFFASCDLVRSTFYVEDLIGSKTDYGQRLATCGNRFGPHFVRKGGE